MIAICDDEPNIRAYLSSFVKKQNMECEITEYVSADEYLFADREHDLLFLDIELARATGRNTVRNHWSPRKSELYCHNHANERKPREVVGKRSKQYGRTIIPERE